MSGLLTITVEEERGFTAVSADIDRLAIVIGCSSLGSGLSSFFLSASSAIADRGYGDAVDTMTQIIEQRGGAQKFPVAFYTTPVDTDGGYGTIDTSDVTGTVIPANGSSFPLGTYEAGILIVTGGSPGTAGIAYKYTLDGGRTYSNTLSLGTGLSIAIPNSGVSFLLNPPAAQVTALVTLVNELRTDTIAHFPLTAGGVHGAADSTSDDGYGAAATDGPTAIVLVNQLRTGILLHFARGSLVHLTADITNGVGIGPAAVSEQDAIRLAKQLKAAYNMHRLDNTYHTADDTTNPTTAPDPTTGTLEPDDTWNVRTTAPQPSTTDVATAFTDIAAATADCALIVLDCDCDAAMAAIVTTGLDALKAVGKRCAAIVRTRLPDFEASETDAAWNASVADDWDAFDDSRVHPRATYGIITDAVTTRQYLRSDLAQFAADAVRVGRSTWPCAPADRAVPNFTLADASGATVGHDEGPRGASTGLSNETLGNRFGCNQRLPDPTRREDVFNTVPWVCFAADERIRNLPTRRLANAIERVAVAAGTPKLGGKVFYTSTGPSSGLLKPASRNAIQGSIYQAIKSEFATEIGNADAAAIDSGLVQVDQAVTISGGNLVGIRVTVAPEVAGYVLSLAILLSVQE